MKGVLIYKCRRCGKENKNTHVPNGLVALASIMANSHTPTEWGGIAGNTEICNCDDGNIGIADLIGLEEDNYKRR